MLKKIALVSLVLILALVNWSIAGKEKHLAEGQSVYLDLAPVDPRSLMQGDYMALRFSLANEVYNALPKTEERRRWRHKVAASDGYVVVSLDQRNIGSFKELYNDQALSKDEILIASPSAASYREARHGGTGPSCQRVPGSSEGERRCQRARRSRNRLARPRSGSCGT